MAPVLFSVVAELPDLRFVLCAVVVNGIIKAEKRWRRRSEVWTVLSELSLIPLVPVGPAVPPFQSFTGRRAETCAAAQMGLSLLNKAFVWAGTLSTHATPDLQSRLT